MRTALAVLFVVWPIAALAFIVRLACAPFSPRVADEMRRHPVIRWTWGGFAFLGVLSLAGCIHTGVWSTWMKADCRAAGREAHWMVALFDESWCSPVGLLLAVVLIAKDRWCPARVAATGNLVAFLAGILIWSVYTYAASQPHTFPSPKLPVPRSVPGAP